jgi:hypothetical protein
MAEHGHGCVAILQVGAKERKAKTQGISFGAEDDRAIFFEFNEIVFASRL